MKWIHHYQLFLFDFDGLLVNTEELHFGAYIEMCRARGHVLPWDFATFSQAAHYDANGLRHAVYTALPDLKNGEPRWEVLYAEKKSFYLKLLKENRLQLMTGVETLLKELESAGIRRCVATHSPLEQIEEIKARLPVLKSIPVWITREDYTLAKPAPDAYLAAIQRLAKPKDEIIGFEDSMRGIKALQAANVRPVLISPPDHPQINNPALHDVPIFHSLEEIPEHVGPYLYTQTT